MSIIFTALTDSPDTVGDGLARLPALRVLGRQVAGNDAVAFLPALEVAGDGFEHVAGSGTLTLPALDARGFKNPGNHGVIVLPRFAVSGSADADLTSDPAAGAFDLPLLAVAGTAYTHITGAGAFDLPALRLQGFDVNPGNYGVIRLPVPRSIGAPAQDVSNRATLLQPAGYLTAAAGPSAFVSLRDALAFELQQTATATLVLQVRLGLEAVPLTHAVSLMQLRDTLELEARLSLVYRMTLQVAYGLGATTALTGIHLIRMADTLVLGGAVSSYREAYALITEALAFGALLDGAKVATFAGGLAFNDTIAVAYQAAMKLVDTLLLGVTLTADVQLTMLLADTLAFGATQNLAREALMQLEASLAFAVNLTLEGEEYVAWTMRADTKAVTRYDHYPFNSFMVIGGKPHGVASTGRYKLEGSDDAGTPIVARLRLALSALGSRVLKRLPEIYYTTLGNGDLLFKVIVDSAVDGAREAHVYRAYVRDGDGIREGRVEPGRGLKAVFFGLELENVDGRELGIDSLQFHPLYLERRVRGNAGGKP